MYFLAAAIVGLILMAILAFHRLPVVSIALFALAGWNSYRFYNITHKR